MSKKIFSILLPPPNVSGSLHMGHALNAFIEDFYGKIAKVNGYEVRLLPGYDHGGISTEYAALKNNKNHQLSKSEKYKIIEEFANNAKNEISQQMEIFKIDTDKKNTMYTMDENHKNFVEDNFIKLYEQGKIYEKERVVFWDPYFQTTLSDLEVIQKEVNDYLYYVKYQIKDSHQFVTVATTRPETIFADVALAVSNAHKHLVGKYVYVPIINREIPVIYDEYVDNNFGTGILKLTPTYDENDFHICEKHKLPKIHIFNEHLQAISNVPNAYINMTINEVKIKILEDLKSIHQLEKMEPYKCKIFLGEKSQQPIETLLRNQWYLDLDPSQAIDVVEKDILQFFPSYWKNTYLSWLNNLKPWCISRENVWGHEMPIFRTKNNKIIVAKTKEEALKKSNGEKVIKENFVLDTWFSSSLWPLSFGEKTGIFPTTTLVTAYDIIFFWVARMVLMTTNLNHQIPFKNVFIHQLIRDERGLKMSKTLGNVINPLEVIKEWGVDILRYALLSKIYMAGNIKFAINDLENAKKNINKLRNAIKFIEITHGFGDIDKNLIIDDEFVVFFINKYKKIAHLGSNLLNDYDIHKYIIELENFFFKEYCDWFIEISKIHKNPQIKYGLLFILKGLLKLFYPLIPDFVEENYKNIFEDNILDNMPKIDIRDKNTENVNILIKTIQTMRSLKNNWNMDVWLKEDISHIHVFKFMKMQIKDEGVKYLILNNIKIYYDEIDKDILEKYKEKKTEKLIMLKNKLNNEKPPEEIKQKMEEEIKNLQIELEEIQEIIS